MTMRSRMLSSSHDRSRHSYASGANVGSDKGDEGGVRRSGGNAIRMSRKISGVHTVERVPTHGCGEIPYHQDVNRERHSQAVQIRERLFYGHLGGPLGTNFGRDGAAVFVTQQGVRGGYPERRRGGADLMQQLENLRVILDGLMADNACHEVLSEMATVCHNKADQLGEFYGGQDPIVARWRSRASILDQAAHMVSECKICD
jgi:hypothetical protein